MSKTKATGPTNEPIHVANHRDLRKNIRAICERFNEHPEIARLVFVNPILAMQDIGVQLEPAARQHVMDALRFPPKLQKRKAALAAELAEALARAGVPAKLPLSARQSAELPLSDPLAGKLSEFERLDRGRLIFQPRQTYEAYKSGQKRHRWIKSVRFKV